MILSGLPITDDHIHIDPLNGKGIEAAKEFQRAGGTHMFLVTKPSWSYGISPVSGEDFREVFETTLKTAKKIRETGIVVFTIMGVHPAEINRLCERMTLKDAVRVMKCGLSVASEYVTEGLSVALKSGRPHYEVDETIWAASNDILNHALILSADCDCALQIHAETGPCNDVAVMAGKAGMLPERVVKHFSIPETPLTPSMLAKDESIPEMAGAGRIFTMESDYMDDNTRPGAVIGPKSVPRFTRRFLEKGLITEESAYRIHRESPSKIYGVEIELP